MRLKVLASLLTASSLLIALADELVESSNMTINPNVSSYIVPSDQPFAKVKINDMFGNLISESQVGSYKIDSINKFYKDQVCSGLYGFNCKANIANIYKYTGIDLTQESGLIGQDFDQINAYKIVYTTEGMDNKEHSVSGAILLPKSDKPLKGVVVFYHFTVLNKDNVPSRFNKDEFNLSKTIASTLATDGYAVLLPDYIGLGDDSKNVHPYVIYPVNNALSGIYMLKLLNKIDPALKFNSVDNQIPLFLSGYSEGAAYSLWAAKILQDNPSFLKQYGYTLTKTVPIDGAYNLSKVTFPFLIESNSEEKTRPFLINDKRIAGYSRPGLVANVLSSYAGYSSSISESMIFNSKFMDCNDCIVDDAKYNVPQLISSSTAGEGDKYKLIYNTATETSYSVKNDSISLLTTPDLINSSDFLETVEYADIYNWKSTTPVSFLTLEYDSIVTRLNSETAYMAMSEQGSSSLNISIIPNQNFKTKSYFPFSDMDIDHPSGLKFLLLFARNQFDESGQSVSKNN